MAKSKKAEPEKKTVTVKKKTRKRAATRANATPAPIEVSAEERWRMIAVAAYHKAEQRGFTPGKEADDWVEAEREIDALLGGPSR